MVLSSTYLSVRNVPQNPLSSYMWKNSNKDRRLITWAWQQAMTVCYLNNCVKVSSWKSYKMYMFKAFITGIQTLTVLRVITYPCTSGFTEPYLLVIPAQVSYVGPTATETLIKTSNKEMSLSFSMFIWERIWVWNKLCELRSSVQAICLFRTPIHSPWAQKRQRNPNNPKLLKRQ